MWLEMHAVKHGGVKVRLREAVRARPGLRGIVDDKDLVWQTGGRLYVTRMGGSRVLACTLMGSCCVRFARVCRRAVGHVCSRLVTSLPGSSPDLLRSATDAAHGGLGQWNFSTPPLEHSDHQRLVQLPVTWIVNRLI